MGYAQYLMMTQEVRFSTHNRFDGAIGLYLAEDVAPMGFFGG